jgi:hypothetical protein
VNEKEEKLKPSLVVAFHVPVTGFVTSVAADEQSQGVHSELVLIPVV